MNLGEIQLFNGFNQLLGLLSLAAISSEYLTAEAYYSISNCFDGNIATLCITADNDINPWLQIDVTGLKFDSIVVYNRNDECGYFCSSRIGGARIALVTDDGMVKWSSTFNSVLPQYTFAIPSTTVS